MNVITLENLNELLLKLIFSVEINLIVRLTNKWHETHFLNIFIYFEYLKHVYFQLRTCKKKFSLK